MNYDLDNHTLSCIGPMPSQTQVVMRVYGRFSRQLQRLEIQTDPFRLHQRRSSFLGEQVNALFLKSVIPS